MHLRTIQANETFRIIITASHQNPPQPALSNTKISRILNASACDSGERNRQNHGPSFPSKSTTTGLEQGKDFQGFPADKTTSEDKHRGRRAMSMNDSVYGW
jgi:hypothetical protein